MSLFKHKTGSTMLIIGVFIAGLIYLQCGSELAGPSEVGNPKAVSATILTENGTPLPGLPVILIPESYNAAKSSDLSSFAKDTTDASGKVELTIGSDSVYYMTSTDSIYRYRLYQKILSADTIKTTDNTISLGSLKIAQPGVIEIVIDSSTYNPGNTVTIVGTIITLSITSPGTYILQSPAGIVTINYCSSTFTAENRVKTINTITVATNDTAKVTTNNYVTEKTTFTTTLADSTPDTLSKSTQADTLNIVVTDTIQRLHYDTTTSIDSIIKIDSSIITDTLSNILDTVNSSDTIIFIDTLISTDTLQKNDTLFQINSTSYIRKAIHLDTTEIIDTITQRTTSIICTYIKRNNLLPVIDLVYLKTLTKVLSPGLLLEQNYTDTLLTINSFKTYDTTTIGDTIFFRDSSIQLINRSVTDSTIGTDTVNYIDTILVYDTVRSVDTTINYADTTKSTDTNYIITSKIDVDTSIIYDTVSQFSDTTVISITYPDTVWIPVTYYDFHSDGSNPEFEQPHSSGVYTGMVSTTLDSTSKPSPGSTINLSSYIKYWFRDWSTSAKGDSTIPVYDTSTFAITDTQNIFHDTAFKNIVIYDSLPFVKTSGTENTYQYDNQSFFPLDNKGFGNEALSHNYSFTMQMSLNVSIGTTSTTITLRGDDDIWVFVNKQLAIDLGGIHVAAIGSCVMNAYVPDGSTGKYPLDLFLAERHTASSSIRIQLNGLF